MLSLIVDVQDVQCVQCNGFIVFNMFNVSNLSNVNVFNVSNVSIYMFYYLDYRVPMKQFYRLIQYVFNMKTLNTYVLQHFNVYSMSSQYTYIQYTYL